MAIVDDVFKGPNLLVHLSIAIAAPIVLPLVGSVVRPLAKATIRGSLAVADVATPMIKGAAAQVGQCVIWPWGQLVALVYEAKQERDAAMAAKIIKQEQKTESAALAVEPENQAVMDHAGEREQPDTQGAKAADEGPDDMTTVAETMQEHEPTAIPAEEPAVKSPKTRKTPTRSSARRPKRT